MNGTQSSESIEDMHLLCPECDRPMMRKDDGGAVCVPCDTAKLMKIPCRKMGLFGPELSQKCDAMWEHGAVYTMHPKPVLIATTPDGQPNIWAGEPAKHLQSTRIGKDTVFVFEMDDHITRLCEQLGLTPIEDLSGKHCVVRATDILSILPKQTER